MSLPQACHELPMLWSRVPHISVASYTCVVGMCLFLENIKVDINAEKWTSEMDLDFIAKKDEKMQKLQIHFSS